MKTFRYKGISENGAELKGVIRAYDEYEAASNLRDKHSVATIVELTPELDKEEEKSRKVKVSDKELSMMCSQFAIILSSGMQIVQCVQMVSGQSARKDLSERLMHVAEDLAGGHTLAQSFEENIPTLPTTFIETIRAGEQSGTLDECFKRLEAYYERTAKVRAKVVGALTYPAIVICVAIAVVVIIMTVAVPMFTSTFEDMGTELPFITKALMAVSDFFVHDWWVLVLIVALIAGAYLIFRRSEEGKVALAKFAITKSPLARIRAMTCASQFASTMSTMVAAGLPIVKALEVTSAVINNYVFSMAVYEVKNDVEQGKMIADSMRQHQCFPNLLTEMCGVGERTGAMENTLDVIGEFYSNEVQMATDKMLSIMEPAITIGLAVITVILLLAVYMPMFSMYGSVG